VEGVRILDASKVDSSAQIELIEGYVRLIPLLNDKCIHPKGGNYWPNYHEPMVHVTSNFLERVKRVAFVGGGDSMLLHEILKYELLELVVALELDQRGA